ncbi:MAG: hypothetical protein V7668_19700, partial [Cereibacter changlensis]
FSGFLSHYLFRDRYGRPGNDKGNAEGLVGYSRSNSMVPEFWPLPQSLPVAPPSPSWTEGALGDADAAGIAVLAGQDAAASTREEDRSRELIENHGRATLHRMAISRAALAAPCGETCLNAPEGPQTRLCMSNP